MAPRIWKNPQGDFVLMEDGRPGATVATHGTPLWTALAPYLTAEDNLRLLDLAAIYRGAAEYRIAALERGAAVPGDPGWVERTLAENLIGVIDAIAPMDPKREVPAT